MNTTGNFGDFNRFDECDNIGFYSVAELQSWLEEWRKYYRIQDEGGAMASAVHYPVAIPFSEPEIQRELIRRRNCEEE